MSKIPGFRSGVLWKKIVAGTFYSLFSLGIVGAVNSPSQPVSPTSSPKPIVEKSTVKTQESIVCEKRRVNDDSLDAGKEVVAQACVNGTKDITWEITKTDGKESARVKKSEKISVEALPEITKVGTRQKSTTIPDSSYNGGSCTSGYINSQGNCVSSPTYSTSGPPDGATARCIDGTYSFSQSRRGTCSHHGGVASWL